ncbi:MAG TPA: 1,4-alpha-glucan branching protein domain-containing protein [Tepidisphaeraceae bacterium]|jgi:1,4-alpha-glucan branching enzyme|nr:1,4-alpha-glucan branching protein domain-containing protein [Tepidisphaeraceae bacterium]
MSDTLGCLCIVLHGHLPYVLNHGSYPHGEAWLYEAAAETYLPILDMIGSVALNKGRPALTIGITPVLLEQLGNERFKVGFVAYLNERMERARADRKEFEGSNQGHFAYLAERWEQWFASTLERFEKMKRDIPGAFAERFREGHVQLLTSNATHAYMPLLLNDEMCRAQMSAGTATSKKHLGIQPRGMWLPECAYRPTWDTWYPPVLYDNPRHRVGIENFIAGAGVTHFFVDTHLITCGNPVGTLENGNFKPSYEGSIHWDGRRGWRQPMSPVGVVSQPEAPKCFAFARHPRVSEQVWSGSIGYPGAGQYLEFHRKYGERGLRYHKVTDNKMALSDKHPYYPDDVPGKVFEHAQHFCNVVKDVLREYKNQTGRPGVVVAPFDAELFGHWWFEGPQFLRDVILSLNNDPEVKLMTSEEALYHYPADKVMRMPEGSWGEHGNHSVWINDKTRWIWEVEYRAEGRFLKLLHESPWKQGGVDKELMTRLARQLLLLQSSDWPFVIHSQGAVDYGIQRFAGHATSFDRLSLMIEHVAGGKPLTDIQKVELADIDAHDTIFQDIDLAWWLPK